MMRSPIDRSGWSPPHVPTRMIFVTPSWVSSSITIAAEGQPMPLDCTDTGFPPKVPVYPSIPRSEFRWTTSSMKVSAMYFARSGSPGRRQASA